METEEYKKFKKGWIKRLETTFWEKLGDKCETLSLIYLFDFCSLHTEVRSDESGQIYLCYIYTKRNESENNLLLQKIFFQLYGTNRNEEYIGFYKLNNKNEDYRNVLLALFLLGNYEDIKDEELKNYLLRGNIKSIFENFQKTGLNADELLDIYINEIISELEPIALNTKNKIYQNKNLQVNSEKFLDFPFIKTK